MIRNSNRDKIAHDVECQKTICELKEIEQFIHVLFPDIVRFICEINGYDAEKIGQRFLEILPKITEYKEGLSPVRVLDLDMDYFMRSVATFINESEPERLSEDEYGDCIWTEREDKDFLEGNLGLSKDNKIRGRVVAGHNESLFFWRELIEKGELTTPFDVIHVDSHADLGLGYSSWTHILDYLLYYPVEERSMHPRYYDISGHLRSEGIGDYLLFAVAYRWISSIVYCGTPYGECNDYLLDTLKDFKEEPIWDKPVQNTIQLLYNPDMPFPQYDDTEHVKRQYIRNSRKEPEVPFLIIPTVEDVHFDGNYDFAVLAQSPNYTPASADFIMDIFREYIIEE